MDIPVIPESGADIANTIVVGHDGSRNAQEALAYALGLAERLRCPVRVVRAWTIDTAPHGTLVSEGYVLSFAEGSEKIARALESDVAPLTTAHPGVHVDCRAYFGQPASELMESSAGALMLVVGTRGRGGFATLLLGSVSEQCMRHARCPVLVVHPRDAEGGETS